MGLKVLPYITSTSQRRWLLPSLRHLILLALLLVQNAAWSAAPLSAADNAKAMDQSLDTIERGLKQGTTDSTLTTNWLRQSGALRDHARDCIVDTQGHLAEALLKLQTLGAALPGESADVRRVRNTLNASKTEAEKLLSSCQLLILRSDDLLKKASTLQQQLLTRRLLARGPTLSALLKENLQQAPDWIAAGRDYLSAKSGMERLVIEDIATLGLLGALGIGAGIALRRRLRRAVPVEESGNYSLHYAATQVLVRYLPALLPSLLIAAFFFLTSRTLDSQPLISLAAYGLPVYVALLCLFRLFIAACPPTSATLALPVPIAKSLTRRLALLALLLYGGFLLFAIVYETTLPEPALQLLRALFIAVFALNLVWALWLLGHVPCLSGLRWPRRSLELALLGIVTMEWLGYRNLSRSGALGLFGSLLLLGMAALLLRLLREFYDGLEIGAHHWQQRLRARLGIKPGAAIPGLNWLRPLTTLVIWSACAFGLLWVWGLSEVGFQQLRTYLMEGFAIGSLHVVPARFMLAAFALTVLLAVSGWFKGRLDHSWLSFTHMERSAREALVTVTGYTGTAIAVIVALGIAGMEFANLAIVAGALSLGIGFGLQNIVNNFVSGLILLFERPIKTGDWIVVGNTEGYVKKISIRYTQIQTFDQSDVIVPNSDLISGQVTNRTLHNARGRIRVPVSITFHGNEPQQVKQLLIDAACEHPLVLKTTDTEPRVLFLSFGDGTLQFELRCHIADINQSGQVQSDLNFAIDAAFRAHGVEMPTRAAAAVKQ